jgi:hypothetical protein
LCTLHLPDETPPRYLLRDRDTIYGEPFGRGVDNLGISADCGNWDTIRFLTGTGAR